MATHLGFGCARLLGGITRRESIALLEAAFDSGIRHFDTAPSYGYGEAESVLGETFRSRRDRITIVTKFGILPPRNQNLLGVARRLVLPLVGHLPSIRSSLSRAAGGLKGRALFSPDALRRSIESSLSALRTDYIDSLLLHEAAVADLSDELLAELERSVAAGQIRAFGIGSQAVAAAQVYRADRRFCAIMQFEWSVLSGDKLAYPGSFLITHGSLSGNFVRLRTWLRTNPQLAHAWSNELGFDIDNATALSRLMLAAARHANPGGITLFSSRSIQNIKTNAELLQHSSVLASGGAFAALVAQEAPAILARPRSESKLATSAKR